MGLPYRCRRHRSILLAATDQGTSGLAHALALAGRVDEAVDLFETAAGLANDLGLMAAEFDADQGEMLGNLPQAFSHVGLVTAANAITECLDDTSCL